MDPPKLTIGSLTVTSPHLAHAFIKATCITLQIHIYIRTCDLEVGDRGGYAKEVMFSVRFVCWSVCLSVCQQNYEKTTSLISMKLPESRAYP